MSMRSARYHWGRSPPVAMQESRFAQAGLHVRQARGEADLGPADVSARADILVLFVCAALFADCEMSAERSADKPWRGTARRLPVVSNLARCESALVHPVVDLESRQGRSEINR